MISSKSESNQRKLVKATDGLPIAPNRSIAKDGLHLLKIQLAPMSFPELGSDDDSDCNNENIYLAHGKPHSDKSQGTMRHTSIKSSTQYPDAPEDEKTEFKATME